MIATLLLDSELRTTLTGSSFGSARCVLQLGTLEDRLGESKNQPKYKCSKGADVLVGSVPGDIPHGREGGVGVFPVSLSGGRRRQKTCVLASWWWKICADGPSCFGFGLLFLLRSG